MKVTRALITLCILIVSSPALAVDIKTTNCPGGWQRDRNLVKVQNPATDIVVFGAFSSTLGSGTVGDMNSSAYDPTGLVDDAFDYANHFGNISTSKVPNWDGSVGLAHLSTGINDRDSTGSVCKVTVNPGDDSLIDIAGPCYFHIQGPAYTIAAATIDPTFAAGENSRFIGVTMNGYTSQTSNWTVPQQRTIIPLARLNTALGDLGPGSTVHLVRDDRFYVSERDYRDRAWMEQAVGALYVTGGEAFANATTNLVLGQYSGIVYNAQGERHTLQEFQNMSAIFLHHSSNGEITGDKKALVVDNQQYDTGAGLGTLLAQRWTNISLLKSPKGANGVQEGGWFYVYGGEYLTQAGAEAAPFDFSEFVSQGDSGLTPWATVIIKKDANIIGTDYFIEDKRSCLVCRP